jgi:hypothetical protein
MLFSAAQKQKNHVPGTVYLLLPHYYTNLQIYRLD